jgi:hypothetical protein
MVQRMALIIGSLEISGELLGVKKVFSELKKEAIFLAFKNAVFGAILVFDL